MKPIQWALAGVGALFLWSRYNTARKAGVPWVEALKAPLKSAKALADEARKAWDDSGLIEKVGGEPKPPPAPNGIPTPPMGSYLDDRNPDAQLTPAWIGDGYDEAAEDLSDYN